MFNVNDLIKNYLKKNGVAVIIVAIVALIIVIKFALPLLSVLTIVILGLVGWFYIKRKSKNEDGTTEQAQNGENDSGKTQNGNY